MIISNFYLVSAYGLVIIVLLVVASFYIWRNLALTRTIKKTIPSPTLQKDHKKQRSMLRHLPFLCFAAFAALALFHLSTRTQSESFSLSDRMIGKSRPMISLPLLTRKNDNQEFTTSMLDGRVALVNFWASWCAPCRLEHPLLMDLAQDRRFELIGINYKDKAENALHFLDELGNPFTLVAADMKGRGAIEWGVYGAPETYLVDKRGIITYRHIGPLTPDNVATKLLPALAAALR